MTAIVTFFPVGNGDMTLIQTADSPNLTVLIDANIRVAADDEEDKTRDVAADLRKRLKRDELGRPYVDAFLLSHPDKDHCTGLSEHFHLGPIADYPDDKKTDAVKLIVIREILSSPMVFRRESKNQILCDDAKAFNCEAKRRVALFKKVGKAGTVSGDRVLILGEDENGKTDDLGEILIKTDNVFSYINRQSTTLFSARLLAPIPKQSDEDEELLSKNHSSTILNIRLGSSNAFPDACQFLTAGDAEVAIWERLWSRHKDTPDVLAYDLMQAPHHCSWHSLSYDSWSELGEDGEVSDDARSALSQARSGAMIVASCKPIKDDGCDPPCIGAKKEYRKILDEVSGTFLCTEEHPNTWAPEPLEIEVTAAGPKKKGSVKSAVAAVTSAAASRVG